MQSPNILYFVCHDLGRHLPVHHVPLEAPNLEQFAAGATVFDQMHCASPACSPSRNCAMTGLPAHQTGGIGLAHMGWPLPDPVRTIVDRFNDAGYETIHTGMQHERHPGAQRYHVDFQYHWRDHCAERGVTRALDYLSRRDRTRPFYLNIGSQEPHPSTWSKVEERYGGLVPPDEVYLPPAVADTPANRERFGRFQAVIRYVDDHFGRLLDGLKNLGHDRDTLVVFTTDHGINHARGKGTLYDAGTEICCIARLPDAKPRRTDALSSNLDFVPTFLDLAGLPIPDELPGRSLLPVIRGETDHLHAAIFTERNFHGEHRTMPAGDDPFDTPQVVDRFDPVRAIRTGRYHYLRWFDAGVKPRAPLPWEFGDQADGWHDQTAPRNQRPAEELYLVANDPLEHFDVAQRPEFSRIKAELADQLHRWMVETDDFLLRNETPARYETPGWGPWNSMPGDEAEAIAAGRVPADSINQPDPS